MPPKGNKAGGSLWLATNPSKRWTEVLFLIYSPFWIIWALCILVPFQLYELCDEWGYLFIGLCVALPCFFLPLFITCKADQGKPLRTRYWVKANLWIAIFGFVGNYFWTHYFFTVLGADYTMPSHRLNNIPLCMYLMTHGYFCFYHSISNILLRVVSRTFSSSSKFIRCFAMGVVIFLLSYATAYMETLTISHYPYYSFTDRSRMYTVGSLFYAIYFFVSFPMFFVMDEDPKQPGWTLWQTTVNSLGASMLVTIILDLWRISIGSINNPGETFNGLPWMPEQSSR